MATVWNSSLEDEAFLSFPRDYYSPGFALAIGAIIRRMPLSSRSPELDDALLSVWRQTLLEAAKNVTVDGKAFAVRKTPRHGLAQVDFEVAGFRVRGLEQNRQTASRWAQLARKGAKVMQFLSGGRYFAVVSDGKIMHYSR